MKAVFHLAQYKFHIRIVVTKMKFPLTLREIKDSLHISIVGVVTLLLQVLDHKIDIKLME